MAPPTSKKRSKQHGEDTDCSRPKKPKSTGAFITDPSPGSGQPRRSGRPGAGSGGHILQLERVGAVIEASKRVPKPTTTLSNDTAPNPVAPSNWRPGRSRKKGRPPPYTTGTIGTAASSSQVGQTYQESTESPHFHTRTTGDRFGFHEPLYPVPPGTEPDLQALNNSYIAERHARERQLAKQAENSTLASSGVGAPRTSFLDVQNIDPSLLATSGQGRDTWDGGEHESSNEGPLNGYEVEHEDEDFDESEPEQPRGIHQHVPAGSQFEERVTQAPRHVPLPPEDDFEYSRDEGEENARALVRAFTDESPETQVVDVLEYHQQKNGYPRAPDPAELTALQNQSATFGEQDGAPRCESRAPRHSRRDRNQPAPPNQLGHYGPVWKDCLEEAKCECRTVHALSNPWPKLKIDVDSLTDSLSTVVMQWNQRGVRFEPGCWPEKKASMVQLLYEDMSTWRSKLKKAAMSSSSMYQLEPAPGAECHNRIAFAQNAAAVLLNQSMFLRDGLDENGKTRNFAHPALKDAIINFFYTGSYRIAQRRPDVFRSRVPNTCLVVICAAFNCVLDGYARSGTGKNSPKFSAKAYVSIYSTLLGLIEELLRDPYHGRRLEDQLARWAWEGWAALQQVDTVVERHDHLQIRLD